MVNSSGISTGQYTSFHHTDLISLGPVPRTSIASSYGGSIFNFFLRNLHTVFHMALLICIPTSSMQGFPFPYLHQLLSLVLFIIAILNWGVETTHGGFDFLFSDD